MLQLTYLALFAAALLTAKKGVIDRRAELLTMPVSMVFFAAVAMASWNVEVSNGAGDIVSVQQPGMFALGLGGALLMMAFTVLAARDRLPTPSELSRNGGSQY